MVLGVGFGFGLRVKRSSSSEDSLMVYLGMVLVEKSSESEISRSENVWSSVYGSSGGIDAVNFIGEGTKE